MRYNVDFDVDSVLKVLSGINEKYQEGSSEDEALRIAAVALLYVRTAQQLDDYREFFRKFYTPAIDAVRVVQTFVTREAADEWLSEGTPRDGDLVRIANQGFQVIPNRDGQGFRFLRTPLPEELMKRKLEKPEG
ncbi:hypothetical protein [Stigmatella erecta]|uniref:Uncharacterized protein n=1 Tax=Stigmatella erecta TaxID=83460 RepID=A0A1I0KQY1_9BACT|nr:hypothetical protein [Stigmatella erecta]SEU28182.1 hypothetical protein SAMN05443639_113120 [Stigmatella erecta]